PPTTSTCTGAAAARTPSGRTSPSRFRSCSRAPPSCSAESEDLPRLLRRRNLTTEVATDPGGALDELRVGLGVHAGGQVRDVLHARPDLATERERRRHDRQVGAADGKRAPDCSLWQQ